jgi:benzoyl-CoA 2,3-dioxygenase component B
MLTEESHHMFVGDTGLGRIIERSCQLMKEAGFSEDVRTVGGIDLAMIQKYINFWFSQSLDLHGSEVSSNAANYFTNGLKGRAEEDKYKDDHVLNDDIYLLDVVDDNGRPAKREVPMRNALNEVLRDWYVDDCRSGIERWNKRVQAHGVDFEFYLPDRKFNRQIGIFSGLHFDPSGHPVSPAEWERRKGEWLPAAKDNEYLKSIQAKPVYEPGKFANYIAPPLRGINQKPIDFEYVRTEA